MTKKPKIGKVSTDKFSTDKFSTDKFSTDKFSTDKFSTDNISDVEEKDLIQSLEADDAEFKSHLTAERKAELLDIAHATMNDEREKITIRISRKDLIRIKSRALQEGLPYQTLINSILHKAVNS